MPIKAVATLTDTLSQVISGLEHSEKKSTQQHDGETRYFTQTQTYILPSYVVRALKGSPGRIGLITTAIK